MVELLPSKQRVVGSIPIVRSTIHTLPSYRGNYRSSPTSRFGFESQRSLHLSLSMNAPIVYGLGSQNFNLLNGVRVSVGVPRLVNIL